MKKLFKITVSEDFEGFIFLKCEELNIDVLTGTVRGALKHFMRRYKKINKPK